MAARSPRRTFAAPFVAITLVACQHEAPQPLPIHDNPPAPEPTPVVQAPGSDAPGSAAPTPTPAPPPPPHIVHRNPPPPQNDPPPPPEPRHWTVSKLNGKCTASIDDACGHIAPGQPIPPCNPPAPLAYTCVPQIPEHGFVKIVQPSPPSGECFIDQPPPKCPPNVMCNPGPPTKVPCPT